MAGSQVEQRLSWFIKPAFRKKFGRFWDEHLKDVGGIADEEGIWLEVEVLFATAAVE